MFDPQTKKFCAAVVEALPELSADVMQGWIGNPRGLQKVLRDGLCPPRSAPSLSVPAPSLDFTVRVDRSVKPPYPNWSDKVMHPELEGTGPAEYNLSRDVEQWLHPDQTTMITGKVIYGYLKLHDALEGCLGLADLKAIQAKGVAIFRALFKGKAVFGWKSVVRDRDSRNLLVPYLYEYGDEVVLHWSWLDRDWHSNDSALRFCK